MSEQTNPQPTAAPRIDDDPAAMDVVPTDAVRADSSTSGEVQARVNEDPAAMDVVPTTLGDPSCLLYTSPSPRDS